MGFPPKGGNASTFTLKAETFPPLLKVDTWWDEVSRIFLTPLVARCEENSLHLWWRGVKNFLYTWWRSLKVRYLFTPSRAVGTTVAQYLRVEPHGTEGEASPLPGTTFFLQNARLGALLCSNGRPRPGRSTQTTRHTTSDRLRPSQRDLRLINPAQPQCREREGTARSGD